jgi:hypothetical protein
MELYRAYFRILRHRLRGVILYVVIVVGIVIIMTIQIPQMQAFYANQMMNHYTDMWADYAGSMILKTKFLLYNRFDGENTNAIMLYSFLNYAAFSIFSITTAGIAMMLAEFQNKDISKRIKITPITSARLTCSLMSASGIFAFFVWFMHVLAVIGLMGKQILTIREILLAVNILALTIAAMGFAFLFKRFLGKQGKSGIIVPILTLLICFVSGIFTPQIVLSDAAKTIAVFTPTYWYGRANGLIGEYFFVDFADYVEVARCMGIQLLFAVEMFIVAMAIDKHREKDNRSRLQIGRQR